ncbi:MAG TPA: prepilin-type N-terminal cleavage/methylation domain-containing protein [Candidatus Paceibacterota bacterium]|nr:prepilin-type N-terminal cleavage/methylation domain-containing protein [Candidatus Paceibacterota bacterium]
MIYMSRILNSQIFHRKNNKGFTLMELLVVVAIIGILSSIVLASLNAARSKSRDAIRRSNLRQLANASEMRFSTVGVYPTTTGWITVGDAVLTGELVPTYISKIENDPGGSGSIDYQYWRKDYGPITAYAGCGSVVLSTNRYGFYAKLENPTSADLATIQDSFDQCVASVWGMNYKVGN